MNIELVNYIIKQALLTVLIASAPPMIIGLIVGIGISVFQAVSQIHEATLAFIPKIVAIFLSLIIFGSWIISVIIKFTTNILANLSSYSGL